MKKQNVGNKITWDKVFSTYYWIIYLDPNHPENTTESLTGYSKSQNFDEADDKELLLMRRIVMFNTKGYLVKALRIDVYKKRGNVINKDQDDVLLVLGRGKYQLMHEATVSPMYQRLRAFLIKFYDSILNGKDVKYLLPNSKANFSKDDWLDVNKAPVMTSRQLEARCARMVSSGSPIDAVYNFKVKYLEKYPQLKPD